MEEQAPVEAVEEAPVVAPVYATSDQLLTTNNNINSLSNTVSEIRSLLINQQTKQNQVALENDISMDETMTKREALEFAKTISKEVDRKMEMARIDSIPGLRDTVFKYAPHVKAENPTAYNSMLAGNDIEKLFLACKNTKEFKKDENKRLVQEASKKSGNPSKKNYGLSDPVARSTQTTTSSSSEGESFIERTYREATPAERNRSIALKRYAKRKGYT